ncbi:hypothetical protein SADUNF_Sadunf08G0146000 [Salix dunnii]|uniref:AAA+ ATPase At3g28540-like C-terminal domain-containing protein n=1 Tax=Salix dunnii TaxID=1413687 RepID=A0A835JUN6_9ROSI|nr:hypothetical protein SADUNF_Sadunf08G0146000 [Salix dunnii]
MANHLKFDIYDLELASLRGNSELTLFLTRTTDRSIIVIAGIDCSIELQHRKRGEYIQGESRFILSGLLNFIDGLWSSCGDERIIVFAANIKDKLDPALLRPGRMDMHVHIEELIMEVEVTPAEVAEEPLQNEDADTALAGIIGFLERKKGMKRKQSNVEEQKAGDGNQEENDSKNEIKEMEGKCEKRKVKGNKRIA